MTEALFKKSFSEKIYDFDRKIVFSSLQYDYSMDPVNRGLSFGRFFLIKYSAAPSEDLRRSSGVVKCKSMDIL